MAIYKRKVITERSANLDITDLIGLYGNDVYSFCRKLAKNKVDSDDLYQETFLKAMELSHKIEKNRNPKGFLISIAVKLWKNKSRKYARRNKIASEERLNDGADYSYIFKDNLTPEDIVISKELVVTIHKAVDTLNDKLRIPLYMHYNADMSNEEIATILRIPLGTVKSRLFKAKKLVRDLLELEANKDGKFRTVERNVKTSPFYSR
jgi:RNA polymerase sigma-70 factor (ECF subfamily)